MEFKLPEDADEPPQLTSVVIDAGRSGINAKKKSASTPSPPQSTLAPPHIPTSASSHARTHALKTPRPRRHADTAAPLRRPYHACRCCSAAPLTPAAAAPPPPFMPLGRSCDGVEPLIVDHLSSLAAAVVACVVVTRHLRSSFPLCHLAVRLYYTSAAGQPPS
ncbi:hypothetical protein DAI22_03g259700 [Oryza sativa Japonica Group]|nr:hypothetical protein DAI22_03g259700 [Oryza sativa Japonica Group]